MNPNLYLSFVKPRSILAAITMHISQNKITMILKKNTTRLENRCWKKCTMQMLVTSKTNILKRLLNCLNKKFTEIKLTNSK